MNQQYVNGMQNPNGILEDENIYQVNQINFKDFKDSENVKRQLFYFIDKFRSLVKSFYKCYEKCEMNEGSDPDQVKELNELFKQLQKLKDDQEEFKRTLEEIQLKPELIEKKRI